MHYPSCCTFLLFLFLFLYFSSFYFSFDRLTIKNMNIKRIISKKNHRKNRGMKFKWKYWSNKVYHRAIFSFDFYSQFVWRARNNENQISEVRQFVHIFLGSFFFFSFYFCAQPYYFVFFVCVLNDMPGANVEEEKKSIRKTNRIVRGFSAQRFYRFNKITFFSFYRFFIPSSYSFLLSSQPAIL